MSVPEGWKKTTVGEACAIKNHLRLPISTEVRSEMKGVYPYFGPTGILGYIDEFRIDQEFSLIGEDGDHFLKYNEKEMTVWHHGKANVNNHAHIVCSSKECLVVWFQRYFQHRDITDALTRQGAKRYKLTKNALEHLEILLPPLAEQKKIAAILSTWDKAIEATDKLLENARQQKKALMQQLLTGKERLPGFEGEWAIKKIKNISSQVHTKSDGNQYPILTISSLRRFVTQEEKYSRYMAGESIKNYTLLKKGEFAYNKGNSKTYQYGCVFDLYESGLVPNVYVCFKLNHENSIEFFRYMFEADCLHNQLEGLVNTGVRNNGLLNIKPKDFFNTYLLCPSPPEQQAIARVLTTADKEIDALTQKAALLRQEKRALMQQLLTGKKRVRVEA